jgi:molybdate transport system substrate-binding protein
MVIPARWAGWVAVLWLLAAAPPCAAETVRVLAAFTLKPALDEIAEDYRKGGGEMILVYGPSPGLAQQVENGLQADLFFSADPMWTDELAQHQMIRPGTVTELIGNHLVLIGKRGTPPVAISPELALVRLIGVGPIAMCDPDSHPAGRMAKASLVSLGLWDGLAAKTIRVENPLLAVKMAASGDVPYAIVFTTDAATDPGAAIVATFPDDSHPPIRYPVAILATSINPDAAKALDYLKSPAAIDVFKRLGYVTLDPR